MIEPITEMSSWEVVSLLENHPVQIIDVRPFDTYCGTGWRCSESWFIAWLMGWLLVSVYDGGWFEWSNDSQNPYETGIQER